MMCTSYRIRTHLTSSFFEVERLQSSGSSSCELWTKFGFVSNEIPIGPGHIKCAEVTLLAPGFLALNDAEGTWCTVLLERVKAKVIEAPK